MVDDHYPGTGQHSPHIEGKFFFNQQVLKLDANESSAQMLQNALRRVRVSHKKIDRVMGIWRSRSGIWRSSVCMATVWSQAVQENPIQIIYQHLSIWLRIPTGKVFVFCFGVSQKSASMVQWGIAKEFVPWSPIFENVLIFEKKGGADAQISIYGLCWPVQ